MPTPALRGCMTQKEPPQIPKSPLPPLKNSFCHSQLQREDESSRSPSATQCPTAAMAPPTLAWAAHTSQMAGRGTDGVARSKCSTPSVDPSSVCEAHRSPFPRAPSLAERCSHRPAKQSKRPPVFGVSARNLGTQRDFTEGPCLASSGEQWKAFEHRQYIRKVKIVKKPPPHSFWPWHRASDLETYKTL